MNMMLRIGKVIALSAILIGLINYANDQFSDWESIYPEQLTFHSQQHYQDWDSLPGAAGPFQIAARFTFQNDPFPNLQKELTIHCLGAYEVYWNGTFLGTNGTWSSNHSTEKPGLIYRKFIIPKNALRPGMNELEVRGSDFLNKARENIIEIKVEPYHLYSKWVLIYHSLISLMAGIFLLVTIYYGFLYFNTFRRSSYLLFSTICGLSFILVVYAYSIEFYPFTYDQYPLRQGILLSLSTVICVMLSIFYLHYFDHPHRRIFYVAIALFLLTWHLFSGGFGLVVFVLGILLPFYLVLRATIKGQTGSDEALIGLIVFMASMMYYNLSVYVGFSILVIIMLFSLSIYLGNEHRAHKLAALRSSLLEAELLRKHIRPHFLMNTLTNIISLIESDPKLSVQLIEALSEEFYTLIEISDKQLISIEKELELCRSHLKIMSIRKDVQYDLQASLHGSFQVPPAIFHTLIENGITHNFPIEGQVQFTITSVQKEKQIEVKFSSYGVFSEPQPNASDGTGLKYIKSRLEESYADRWELKQGSDGNCWTTLISFDS